MIFIDVTGACKSPKNTGMQRITRHIFRRLSARVPTTGICWNLVGNRYQYLGQRERDVLESPFQVLNRPSARPEIRGEHFFAELHRQFFRDPIDLPYELGSGDVLLIPDIYRDGRLAELPRIIAQGGARTVAIFHDAAALRLPSLYPKAHPRFRDYIVSLAVFDLVICVSHSSRDELLRLWNEFGTLPTETAVETWPVELAEDEQGRPWQPARDLIVSVGSFEPRKNQITLLRAAEKLWESGLMFDLELIGRSTNYFGGKVKAELRRLRRANRAIRWSKHVNDQTLHRSYGACRFTVYPSLMEGFGLPVAESLAHGKPCICGGNGALGEIARGGGCLIIDQSNGDELAQGIEKLLTEPDTYDRLSIEARARKFRSWADYTEKLLEHLEITQRQASVPVASEN
jgi:glycosyltransferase involved in cell wall biosynthesis